MKKNLFGTVAFVAFAGSAMAQLPVGTAPQNKKAVLEEFTGIHCGYCPDGHVIANNIHNNDPNNVILINIHSGSFANSNPGEQDFKTAEGNAIDAMPGMGITGYPAGNMNRTVLSGNVMAGGRNLWNSWAQNIKSQPAYCNVAVQGSIDVQTRVLTVQAEVYYTANSPVATNSLHIMLLESNIPGIQTNYGTPYWNLGNYNTDGTYNHNHVLRKAITPTFGSTIPVTTQGTTHSASFTYTVPLLFGTTGKTTQCLLGNLELVAFVTETNVKTINAAHGPLTLTNFANNLDIGANSIKSDPNVCLGTNFKSNLKFINYGSTPVTSVDFDYSVNGNLIGTYNWSGNVMPMTSSSIIDIPPFSFPAQAANSLSISVASVNGGNDQVAANNIVGKNVPFAPIANDLNIEFNFTQDQWGAESTWSIVEEATNNVMISGGPYTNLAAAGTVVHTDSFVATYATCYKIIVNDSYGDGINNGTDGVGGYNLKANGLIVLLSNGKYGLGEEKYAKTYDMPVWVGLSSSVQNIKSVDLFPNPASGATNLSVNLSQNESVGISVLNSLGQEVYASKSNSFAAGENNVTLNTESWASGVYFINVSTQSGSLKRKLTVTH